MNYREIQEKQVTAMMASVDSLGDAIDLMIDGSPWRTELQIMLIRICEMRVQVSDDLAATSNHKLADQGIAAIERTYDHFTNAR